MRGRHGFNGHSYSCDRAMFYEWGIYGELRFNNIVIMTFVTPVTGVLPSVRHLLLITPRVLWNISPGFSL